MVSLGSIAALATIIGIPLTLYLYKASRMESKRQRERYLQDNLAGRGWKKRQLIIQIDNVKVVEANSIRYKLKRLFLRPLDGKSQLNLKVGNGVIDKELWETEIAEIIREELVDFRHIDSEITGQHMMVYLEVESIDEKQLMNLVIGIVESIELVAGLEGDTLSIEQFDPAKFDELQ